MKVIILSLVLLSFWSCNKSETKTKEVITVSNERGSELISTYNNNNRANIDRLLILDSSYEISLLEYSKVDFSRFSHDEILEIIDLLGDYMIDGQKINSIVENYSNATTSSGERFVFPEDGVEATKKTTTNAEKYFNDLKAYTEKLVEKLETREKKLRLEVIELNTEMLSASYIKKTFKTRRKFLIKRSAGYETSLEELQGLKQELDVKFAKQQKKLNSLKNDLIVFDREEKLKSAEDVMDTLKEADKLHAETLASLKAEIRINELELEQLDNDELDFSTGLFKGTNFDNIIDIEIDRRDVRVTTDRSDNVKVLLNLTFDDETHSQKIVPRNSAQKLVQERSTSKLIFPRTKCGHVVEMSSSVAQSMVSYIYDRQNEELQTSGMELVKSYPSVAMDLSNAILSVETHGCQLKALSL